MAPSESATGHPENQASRRKRLARRPRARLCLLKGCEQRFHPRQESQRYCSEGCQKAARKWSRWKAQQRYRTTQAGKRKRNVQSQRYRARVKSRKPAEPQSVNEAPRVITPEHFFRPFLRPARMLRDLWAPASKSFAAFLFTRVPSCAGARGTTGAPLATSPRFNPDILSQS